jgi:phosphohistidine phosphatase SixA
LFRNRTSSRGFFKAFFASMALASFAVLPACQPSSSENEQVGEELTPTVIYLVRHAEKADENPEDPALTEPGQARADLLVHLLAEAELDAVWSTDTRRTRNTAAPVADAKGLSVELYDPRGVAAFAQVLKARGGQHLVVGHSNTTPSFVEALGGDAMSAIVDAEYDRFYIVTAGPDGHVETVLLRFGEPYVAP